MAERTHRAKDGEMIDLIALRHYGRERAGNLEAILEANYGRGLASQPPKLSAGVIFTLPDEPAESTAVPTIALWDE